VVVMMRNAMPGLCESCSLSCYVDTLPSLERTMLSWPEASRKGKFIMKI
jgi:hypothetical protein